MNQSITMKTSTLLLLALLFILNLHAQIPDRPKITPEHKKLEAWVGEWKYEGSTRDSPLGPGGKFAGKQTAQMILDGLFLETRAEDKGVYGGKEYLYKGVVLQWYDHKTKTYLDHIFTNDGAVRSGVTTVTGNTWTLIGTSIDSQGKSQKTRSFTTFSADGKTWTQKGEVSMDDGKTWMPCWEQTAERIKK